MSNKPVLHAKKLPHTAAVSAIVGSARARAEHTARAADAIDISEARAALSPIARAELDAPYRLGATLDLMRRFARDAAPSDAPRRVIPKRKRT